VSAQGPQRRVVFDPLVDGVMMKRAGKLEMEIAAMMKDAGVGQPRALDIVEAVASPEYRAWRRLSAKEKNDHFLAQAGREQQAQRAAQTTRAAVDEHRGRFEGLGTVELDAIEEELNDARMAAWVREQAIAEAEQEGLEAHLSDPAWNDPDDGEADDEFGDEVA
jgi:hypothetical protein